MTRAAPLTTQPDATLIEPAVSAPTPALTPTLPNRTPRPLLYVPLAALSLSTLNVRKHGTLDTAALAANIAAIGLLQPLIVRPTMTGDPTTLPTYEVLGGRRRLKALQVNAKADPSTDDLVPVIILAPGDDAAAVEASLAENIERLPMDEFDQYTAFATLIKQGRSEAQIATSFGTTPQIVRRRLALARLIPDIHRAYRAGDIDPETLKMLTLAPRDKQRAYIALLRDPDQNPPPRWQLRAWLLGGAELSTSHALFDETLYTGDITGDLFGTERYFADAEQFWTLQNQALAALADDYKAKGWSDVRIIGPAEPFRHYEWEDVPKKQGGAVVLAVAANGAVETHKGLLTQAEAKRAAKLAATQTAKDAGAQSNGSNGATGGTSDGDTVTDDDTQTTRPELSGPLETYIDLVRVQAVKAALIKSPKAALRLLAAHLMCGSTHIRATRDPLATREDSTRAAVQTLPTTQAIDAATADALTVANLDADTPLLASDPSRVGATFAHLQTLPDAAVIKLLAVVMAQALATGTELVDTIGTALKVDVTKDWTPDDTLFDLIRDKQVTGELLADVIGKDAAASYLTHTGTAKKQIIRNALTGTNRPKVVWSPHWMTFPQGNYTRRRLSGSTKANA